RFMKRNGSEALLKHLLAQPSLEQARAVLTGMTEELTAEFFELLSATCSRLGRERKFEEADHVASVGVEAAQLAGREDHAYTFMEARCLIAVDAGDVEEASSKFSDALHAATKVLDGGERAALRGVISASANLANLEVSRKNFEEARAILSRARALCHDLKCRAGELWTIANLASVCVSQGEYENALQYLPVLVDLYGVVPAEGEDGFPLPEKAALY